MCCEEHHICLSCNQLLAAHLDRCAAARMAAVTRDPGTEFGSMAMRAADSWCPETEWIVEQFLHDVDDGCCPNCSRHDHGDVNDDAVGAVDHLSGEIMHPAPMLLPLQAAAGSEAEGASASADDDSGGALSPTSSDDDDSGGKAARRGWKMRVRQMMAGGSKREAAGNGKAAKRPGVKAGRFAYRVLE